MVGGESPSRSGKGPGHPDPGEVKPPLRTMKHVEWGRWLDPVTRPP